MASGSARGFVPTKSSLLKEQPHNFKIIVYNKHKKSTQKKNPAKSKPEKIDTAVDMKKARFEVYKFSKSALNFSSRQKSNIELAIKLGGKPPKNEAKNYKQLLAEKSIETSAKEKSKFVKEISRNYKTKMAGKKKDYSNKTLKSKQDTILKDYGKAKSNVKKRR